MNSVTRDETVFPQLENKVFFDLKFAFLDLDFSVRECSSLVKNLSYQESFAQFKDPEEIPEHEENNPENL